MAASVGLAVLCLLIGSIHAEQAAMQELGLDEHVDVTTQLKQLQTNITDLWTYIFKLRQAVEHHLTQLTRQQSRLEHSLHHVTHSGGMDSHGHDHHTGDYTSGSSDHHQHEEHGSSYHRQDDHGSSDHHHDDHGSSDHHHDDHGSSDHHHDDHGTSDHHHDDHGSDDHHHHDSHGGTGSEQHSHQSDHHDDHHHSTSESHSHTDGEVNHTDSDHGHGDHHDHHGDDHHSSHEHSDSHGDHQHSHEHKDSHEKQDKVVDDQQSVEDIEKPFTSSVVNRGGQIPGSSDRTQEPGSSDPLNLLGRHSHHHHHHHHHDHDQKLNATKVTIPKFSEYRQYNFATCNVQPNRVLSPELQQNVEGQVSFWQRKSGGPLNIHVRLRGFAIGDHHGHQEQQQQQQDNETPAHQGGHRHGFHVHEFGDLSAGCQSTGPHYNPLSVNHGGPRSSGRHVGDLGNIECDDHGVTNIVFPDNVASLIGQYSILGKALVVHSDADDYGVNTDDPGSITTGNAGVRIACCVIQKVDKLPLATYKSIKSATNFQN